MSLLAGVASAVPVVVESHGSGPWSAAATWEGGHVPAAGESVLIKAGHRIVYDIASDTVIRAVHVGGILTFSREKDTRLCVGLIKIQPGADTSEDGFDCHAPMAAAAGPNGAAGVGAAAAGAGDGKAGGADGGASGTEAAGSSAVPVPMAALEVGTAAEPIPAGRSAVIRLTAVEGLDPQSCPAIISCGGRMDLHGAPLAKTWVKLGGTNENSFEFDIHLAERVEGWKKGDRILLTGTRRRFPGGNYSYGHDEHERPQSETIVIGKTREENGRTVLECFDYPPSNRHEGGPVYAGEAANLSRNVVIESADPKGARGHTMYHRNSSGSISYAEFRHLGKEGVLGRYPIHFHLCGDTMRGSSVTGASIWDSANRFLTIHGTDYLVVRDCVGFKSVGHGFFLEDGTETRNVLDHNLSCLALRAKPLPEQVLSFDQNDGAGFWWSNSLNSFTRNVAVECDQHGYRFEVIASAKFNPVLSVRQPDGRKAEVDIRTLPFIRFEDNEAHCMSRFGINLGGFNGLSMMDKPDDGDLLDVDGVGPDKHHPFNLRNTKLWDCDWAYHSGSPSVLNQRMTIHRVLYGVWRINAQLQEHERLEITDVVAASFYFPRAGRLQQSEKDEQLEPVDDFPPVTIITSAALGKDGQLHVSGTATDNGDITEVSVNGQPATATAPNFAQWEITLPGSTAQLTAASRDDAGNAEKTPHRLTVAPVGSITKTGADSGGNNSSSGPRNLSSTIQ